MLSIVTVAASGAMPILLVLPCVADWAQELQTWRMNSAEQATAPQQIASGERVTHVHHSWLALQWSMRGVTLVGMTTGGVTAVGQSDCQTESGSCRQMHSSTQQRHTHMHNYTQVFKCCTH